jgi:KDO2-lipid IV(A) lauroyltransferase
LGRGNRFFVKKIFLYIIARIAAAGVFVLPMRLGVFLGGKLGVLLFFLLKKQRLLTIENLTSAFGAEKSEKEIYNTAKAVFRNLGKNAAEFINFPKINSKNIDRLVETDGFEKIDRALAEKKGCIILSCHLGNWELSAAYASLKGYPANAIARPLRDERFDRLVNGYRASKGIGIISRDSSFKKIVGILKSNQMVGILPDQDIDSVEGVFVNFFNRRAYTPAGPVLLSMVSGAPIIPIFCIRQNGKHKFIVEEPIKLEITGDKEKDILINTQKWSDVTERYIRKYPEQWVWMHRRWKTQSV